MRDGFFGVCLQCSLRLAPAAAVALAVFEAVRCLVGPGFEVLCLGSGALGTDSWVRSGCWLARGRACARRKAQGFKAFALCAMGFLVFAFNARSGSLPLRLWLWLCLGR